jgi:hypothetical protein
LTAGGYLMTDSAKFTLRFHNERTHALLGTVADQLGLSKNGLAEQMLERELEAAALLVGRDLEGTLRRLHAYQREERLEGDIDAFATAEAYSEDPLKARMAEPVDLTDAYGVMEAFGA